MHHTLDSLKNAIFLIGDKIHTKSMPIPLEKVMKNRTSIVIAHRLSTIQHCDNIIVMRDGSIIERGKHEELLQMSGVYKKLVELQGI